MTEVYVLFSTLLLNVLHKGSSNSTVVCSGDRFILTCNTSANELLWTLMSPLTKDDIHTIAVLQSGVVSPPNVTLSHTVFQVSITSTSPLTSEIITEDVMANVNGINVTCSSLGAMTTSTTIILQNGSAPNVTSIMVREHYGTENVTVVLDWIEEQHVMYNLTITTPNMGRLERRVESSGAQLMLSYNTVYSIRLVATLCGQNSTSNFELQYVTCDHPPELPNTAVVTGYRNPALVGTNITISSSCPPGENNMQTEVNATFYNTYTCMSDGQWEPDPNEINVGLCNNAEGQMTMGTYRYPTTTPMEKVTAASAKTAIIIGCFLGILLFTGLVIMTVIVIFRRVGFSKYKAKSVSQATEPVDVLHQLDYQNTGQSEYSLLQPLTPNQEDNQVTLKKQTETLVYADVGPLSLGRQLHNIADTLDDNRVVYADINMQLKSSLEEVKPAVSPHPCDHADNYLNLDVLLVQVKHDITPHWYQFGKSIGVENKVLDKCLHYPPEESIIEICDHWLRNHTGQPTWREVAEALKQIGFKKLAIDIEQVYETGKLAREVDWQTDVEESIDDPPPIPPKSFNH